MLTSRHARQALIAGLLSAGCTNATNRAHEEGGWRGGVPWSLDPTPELQVGADPSDSLLQFTSIRQIRSLPDGRILVGHLSRPPAVFVLDSSGQLLAQLGREGDGPGELRTMGELWVASADTVIVYDYFGRRLNWYLADGEFVQTVRFAHMMESGGESSDAILAGRFADGTYLARPNRVTYDAPAGSGILPRAAERWDAEGAVIDTIGIFPDIEYVTSADGRSRRPRFGARAAILATDSAFYVGFPDTFRLEQYNLLGQLEQRFERPFERRPVTDGLLRALRDVRLELATSDEERTRLMQPDEGPIATHLPAFGRQLLVDTERNLWVASYTLETDTTRTWSVFASDGSFLGDLQVPSALAIHEVGRDYVLGVWTDDLDIPSVVRFRLHRSLS